MLSPSIAPMVSTKTRKGVWEGGFWKRVAGPEAGQHKVQTPDGDGRVWQSPVAGSLFR